MNGLAEAMIKRITEGALSDMVSIISDYKNSFITGTDGFVVLPYEESANIRAEIVMPEDESAYLKISFRNKKGWEICCNGDIENSSEVIMRAADTLCKFYVSGHLQTVKQKSTVCCV